MSRILIFIWGTLLFLSCDSESEKQAHEYKSYVVVNGDTLHVTRYDNSVLSTVAYVDGEALSAQGCAIKDNFLYRFYDRGYCKVFQIHDDYNLSYVKEFKLGSYRAGNHMNGVQFYPDSDILYSSEFYERSCNVEKINLHEGRVDYIQKIHISETEFLENCKLNIICGDDGFLWAFGSPGDEYGKMVFVKFRLPELTIKDVLLDDKDVIDHWSVIDDFCMQGGKVKGNYLYFLSGSASYKKRLMVFDTNSHLLYRDISLDDVILEEPEDCDVVNNHLIITVYGGSAYYVLDL